MYMYEDLGKWGPVNGGEDRMDNRRVYNWSVVNSLQREATSLFIRYLPIAHRAIWIPDGHVGWVVGISLDISLANLRQ